MAVLQNLGGFGWQLGNFGSRFPLLRFQKAGTSRINRISRSAEVSHRFPSCSVGERKNRVQVWRRRTQHPNPARPPKWRWNCCGNKKWASVKQSIFRVSLCDNLNYSCTTVCVGDSVAFLTADLRRHFRQRHRINCGLFTDRWKSIIVCFRRANKCTAWLERSQNIFVQAG